MKITRVTPYLVAARPSADGWSRGHEVLLVRLESAEGLIGWGEAYVLSHRQRAIAEIIKALGAALVAMPEATPRSFLTDLAQPMMSKHPSIDYASAVSALEIGLWDLAGRQAGQPVHALLGGAVRDRIPLYANVWDNPLQAPEAISRRCARLCRDGYRAVKIYPLRQPTLAAAEDVVRLTREAVGDDIQIMLDFAVEPDADRALQAARRVERYAPYWIEEPAAGDDPDLLARFRRQVSCRITTGERQAGVPHFRMLLARGAADVFNPDIVGVGGLLTMLEIGALAQAQGVEMSPHNWNSTTVAYMAMLQACAVMPNATYAELFYDYLETGEAYASCDTRIEDGAATLPTAPGLGVRIDEDALARMAVTL